MLVRKTLSLSNCKLEVKGEKGFFAGYASVFGGVDTYGDTILRGAFEETLRINGMPKMFYNHVWDMPIGKYPVAREDDHGLWVEGEITPNLMKANDVRAALEHGTLDGLSIGGFLRKGDYDETAEGGRVIRHWTKLVEVSPVVFPADSAARIDLGSVKSEDVEAAISDIETIRDFERFLRDAGGLSKGLSAALVSRIKTVFGSGDPAGGDLDEKAAQEISAALNRLQSVTT